MDLKKSSAMNGNVNAAYDDQELSSSATSASGSIERETQFVSSFFGTEPSIQVDALKGSVPNGVQQNSSSSIDEQLLIVEQETRDEESRRYKRKKTLLLSALKCILSIMMSITLFVCVVVGKISLVHIGQRLNYTDLHRNSSSLQAKDSKSPRETSFIMLVMIVVFPSFYTLLRATCTSGMKRSHPWPTQRAIVWVSFYKYIGAFLNVLLSSCGIGRASGHILVPNALCPPHPLPPPPFSVPSRS